MINPCEDCIVETMCNKMCPRVVDFYKPKVRKRNKSEIEEATGYLWYEDSDKHDFFTGNVLDCSINKNNVIPNVRIGAFKKVSLFRRCINQIQKGLNYVGIRRTKIL